MRIFNELRIQYESGSELAHLLQGAEAAALLAVVMQQQGNILLCVHDGRVTAARLDVDALTTHIQAETGYHFGIDEGQLASPGQAQIKRELDEFEAFSEGELLFECPFAVAQGGQGSGEGLGEARRKPPAAGPPRFTPSDEAELWTSHPHPADPVLARLAYVSPRPAWNLPPGSTAEFVVRKRREAAALSATEREARKPACRCDDARPDRVQVRWGLPWRPAAAFRQG